jgi:nitroreductase
MAEPAAPSGRANRVEADVLGFLLGRYSVGPKKLAPPGPSREELRVAAQAALRAPDHEHLVPFRFVTVGDEARPLLARLFEECARRNGHDDDEARAEGRRAWNGPVLVAAIARIDDAHQVVPAREQWVCVGGALANFLNALHLMGYGAKLLSGRKVDDPAIRSTFCGDGETLVGWIVAGTPTAAAHARVADDPDAVLGEWRGAS